MKIVYLSGAVLPSRTANSIHIMKMCQAFAVCGHDVTLFAHVKNNTDYDDVFNHYGIEQKFEIQPEYKQYKAPFRWPVPAPHRRRYLRAALAAAH